MTYLIDRDRVLARALVKPLEIVGEASSRVTAERQPSHPGVPWRDIVAMRNRLIRGDFDVDLDRVWDTVTDDLPPLRLDGRLSAETVEALTTKGRRLAASGRPGRSAAGAALGREAACFGRPARRPITVGSPAPRPRALDRLRPAAEHGAPTWQDG